MSYDLAMYDDGMGMWISPEMLKTQLMAGVAGAGGILATSFIVQKVGEYLPADMEPMTKRRVKNAIAIGIGVLGGRAIWEKDRNMAMGFVGGVAGLGLAQLVASFSDSLSTDLSGGLSSMDLASLEAAVSTSSQPFSPGLSGPTVSERALSAPGVSAEVLAEYAPYLS